jgi:hypothetical protein
MTDLPEWAQPGCFGQALTYSENIVECRGCPFATSCKTEHLLALARMREEHGIVIHTKPHKTASVSSTSVTSGSEMTLPKKVESLLANFERAGIKVSEAFAVGVNPFAGIGPKFMRITAHALLRLPGGILRAELINFFETKLKWSKGTAAAHATQAFQALIALGVAEELNGRLIKKRMN